MLKLEECRTAMHFIIARNRKKITSQEAARLQRERAQLAGGLLGSITEQIYLPLEAKNSHPFAEGRGLINIEIAS